MGEPLLCEEAAVSETVPMVSVAADSDAREWDTFVESQPEATGYHVWAWRNVIHDTFGHESIYLMARAGQSIVGILPLVFIKSRLFGRTMTSMPFLNYGGVVATSDVVARALVTAAANLARDKHCRHVELRHASRRFPDLPVRQHKVTMLLRLEAGMWDRLDRKVRNQIRKAQKSNLVAETGGRELVRDFYAVFARNMRDLGTPVYTPRLFENVIAAFPDRAGMHVVRLDGRPIAAGLRFRYRKTVEVPWASSIRDFNNLCPNHLLYWSVLEEAVRDGCTTLDFGRSTPNEGTYKFKEQWGAVPLPLHWEYGYLEGGVPNVSPSNPKYSMVVEAWKRLPLPVATALGPYIVRAIP